MTTLEAKTFKGRWFAQHQIDFLVDFIQGIENNYNLGTRFNLDAIIWYNEDVDFYYAEYTYNGVKYKIQTYKTIVIYIDDVRTEVNMLKSASQEVKMYLRAKMENKEFHWRY